MTCQRREQIERFTWFKFSIFPFHFLGGEQREFAVSDEIHMVAPHGLIPSRLNSPNYLLCIQADISWIKFLGIFSHFGANVWYILSCRIKYTEWDANSKSIRIKFCYYFKNFRFNPQILVDTSYNFQTPLCL